MSIAKEQFLAEAGDITIILPDGTELVAKPCEFKTGSWGWKLPNEARRNAKCQINGDSVRLVVGTITVSGSKPAEPPSESELALLHSGDLAGAVKAYRDRNDNVSRNKALKAFGLDG